MRQTSARQLLDGWDSVRGEAMPVRAAALAALSRAVPASDAMLWSIARRDRALFDFRADLFGDQLDAVATCPACADPLEMQFALSQIRPADAGCEADADAQTSVIVDGVDVSLRPPNTLDLLEAGELRDARDARRLLLERCVGSDDAELRERAVAMCAAEPTDVQLDLTCPSCAHAWQTPFDIAPFVWTELDEWAQRTLNEIHVIAGAYGWTEDEILQLSASRRATYVGMIR